MHWSGIGRSSIRRRAVLLRATTGFTQGQYPLCGRTPQLPSQSRAAAWLQDRQSRSQAMRSTNVASSACFTAPSLAARARTHWAGWTVAGRCAWAGRGTAGVPGGARTARVWRGGHARQGRTGPCEGEITHGAAGRGRPATECCDASPGAGPGTASRRSRSTRRARPARGRSPAGRRSSSSSMGEVVVGDPYAWIPRSFAIRRTRSMCVRSDTNTARRATLAEQLGDRFQRLEGRAPWSSPTIALAGTFRASAYSRATAASVVRSPSCLPPVTTSNGAIPARRARPRGPAAPRTPATAVRRTARPKDDGRVGRTRLFAVALLDRPGRRVRPVVVTATRPPSARRIAPTSPAAGRHRPWHFLYLFPDPHQQGSLRRSAHRWGCSPGGRRRWTRCPNRRAGHRRPHARRAGRPGGPGDRTTRTGPRLPAPAARQAACGGGCGGRGGARPRWPPFVPAAQAGQRHDPVGTGCCTVTVTRRIVARPPGGG